MTLPSPITNEEYAILDKIRDTDPQMILQAIFDGVDVSCLVVNQMVEIESNIHKWHEELKKEVRGEIDLDTNVDNVDVEGTTVKGGNMGTIK